MNDEFTITRVKKRLEKYCTALDAISEEFANATYDQKEELMVSISKIHKEIESEKERANKNNDVDINIESANYLPALEEASMYLGQALAPESNKKVIECLHDASFSLGYYLNHA